MSKSDLVIDIHDTSPTKNFTPFMFADDLSVNHVIPSEIRFCIKRSSKELLAAKNKNQSSKGTASEWFMQSIGKQWICVEVGTLDKDNSDLAYNITKNILQFYQMIEGKYIDYNKDKKDIYYWDQFYTYDPENFEFAEWTYEWKELQSWEVIWYIEKYWQQKEVKATQPCKILFMLDKNNYDQIRKVPSHIQKFSWYALINKIE